MIYHDEALVRGVTEHIRGLGISVFQPHWLAETEEAHVRELLRRMDPPVGARILDAGCGVGGVADRMQSIRPDLEFVLLNVSASQLAMCPEMEQVCADFHEIPLPDRSVDVVMFGYSLGHGDERVLSEAFRVLRPRGFVFLYDLTGEPRRLAVDYECRSLAEFFAEATGAGFRRIYCDCPEFFTGHFSGFAGAEIVLEGTRPVVMKFWKEG